MPALIAAKVLRARVELCDGCRMCELVCSIDKTGSINPHLARIRVAASNKGLIPGQPRPTICRHCNNALCAKACARPGAMQQDAGTGAWVIDESQCDRCLACVEACPFDAIWVGPKGDVLKCDLCCGEPLCVKYCPYRPENSLPNLPYPKQSCLQFVERRK